MSRGKLLIAVLASLPLYFPISRADTPPATRPATKPTPRVVVRWELLPGAPAELQKIIDDQPALLKDELRSARHQRSRLQNEHRGQWQRADVLPDEEAIAKAWMENIREEQALTDRWIKDLEDHIRPAMEFRDFPLSAKSHYFKAPRASRFHFRTATVTQVLDANSAYVSFHNIRRVPVRWPGIHFIKPDRPIRIWMEYEYRPFTTPPLLVVGIDTTGLAAGQQIELSPFFIHGSVGKPTEESPTDVSYRPFDPEKCFRWVEPPAQEKRPASRPTSVPATP